jgi:hypothetical protein
MVDTSPTLENHCLDPVRRKRMKKESSTGQVHHPARQSLQSGAGKGRVGDVREDLVNLERFHRLCPFFRVEGAVTGSWHVFHCL